MSAIFQDGAFCPGAEAIEGREGIVKDLAASGAEDFGNGWSDIIIRSPEKTTVVLVEAGPKSALKQNQPASIGSRWIAAADMLL